MSPPPPATASAPEDAIAEEAALHSRPRTGFGSSTVVNPLYVHSSGREATVGRISLYRHGKSSTSSAKPGEGGSAVVKMLWQGISRQATTHE